MHRFCASHICNLFSHLRTLFHPVWLLPLACKGLNKRIVLSFSGQCLIGGLFKMQRPLRAADVWDMTK